MRVVLPRSMRSVLTASCVVSVAALFGAGATTAAAFTTTVVTSEAMSEPGVAVAPDNTIYVDGPEGLLSHLPGSPSPVFRSEDGGTSWTKTPFSLRENLPGGGDSEVAIDPTNGAIYMTDLWLGDSTVSTSSDKGNSWTANPLQGLPVQDRQWVATTGAGIVYHAVHQIPLGLVVSKGSGGLVYPVSTLAATPVDQTGCICASGNLIAQPGGGALGSNDKVGLIYATSSGGIKFAGSSNGALTFANVNVQPESANTTNAAFPVVANAGGNHLVATWLNVQGSTSSVAYSDSHDWGASWSAPRTLVSGGASVYPWIAAQGSKIAISLYHTSTPGTPDTAPGTAQWFEAYLQSTDGGTTFSAPESVDTTVAKSGPVCTEGTNCSANRELGDFQSLALDNQGNADLVWVHSFNGTRTEVRFSHQ
ncbi:MAG TPA: sialidase family protein [Solirubrobacteraceae bacterium]|jgi:hypothetical protein|nr:sialidase family protein [Solirubrobacteraceae bacterium]